MASPLPPAQAAVGGQLAEGSCVRVTAALQLTLCPAACHLRSACPEDLSIQQGGLQRQAGGTVLGLGGGQAQEEQDEKLLEEQCGALRLKLACGPVLSTGAPSAGFTGGSEQAPLPAKELCQSLCGGASEKTLPEGVWLRKQSVNKHHLQRI